MGNLRLPVAAVERFEPDERCGIGGPPVEIARPGAHAPDGHVVRQRHGSDMPNQAPGGVTHINLAGKAFVGREVRKGPVKGLDEQVLAIGRGQEARVQIRLEQRGEAAACRIDEQQPGGAVIFEQVFVLRVLEHVAHLVGAAGPFAAGSLLNGRPPRRRVRLRRRALCLGHRAHQQGLLVGHPLQRRSEERVEAHARDSAGLRRRPVADPELDRIGPNTVKAKRLPSALQAGTPSFASAGRLRVRSWPPGSATRLKALQ